MSDKKGSTPKGAEAETGPSPAANFGDLGFTDAGMAEAVGEAQAQAETIVTDINKKRNATEERREAIRQTFSDIRRRAHAIDREVKPDFREAKPVNIGGTMANKPLLTDANIMDAFAVLFGTGEDRPHFDTFRGMTIGWNKQVIDDNYDLSPLVDALVTFGLPGPPYDRVEKLFKRFARQVRKNSLIERLEKVMPQWDGVPRAEMELITRFATLDTPLNREFGFYFWLSIYCRAMYPGCNASMVLALFGAHGIGKSYMGKIICEEMLGRPDADTVTLDWSLDFNAFLRNITGNSIIANVAEMAGFNRAEMTKIKNLTTRTVDVMDYKWERSHAQERQWVMVMDGNEYKGLQRDETGNRRFYPMFVGQLPYDSRGQVQWQEDFYVNFDGFRSTFWQIMAECAAWIADNGMEGYNRYVSALEKKVKAFSADEMANDRGTVRDDDLDTYLIAALKVCEIELLVPNDGVGRPGVKRGIVVSSSSIRNALMDASKRGSRFIPSHIKPKMTALGAVYTQLGAVRVYIWPNLHSLKEWDEFVASLGTEEGASKKTVRRAPEKSDGDGGF